MNRVFRFFHHVFLSGFILFFVFHIDQASALTFRRPVDAVLSPTISAYYDHNTSSGILDFACSANTYNNHRGTDFRGTLGTNIYAAARGGLYNRYDGCSTWGFWGSRCGGGFGNHVRIDHEGIEWDGVGWKTIYAHMQAGTPVGPQSLYCGRYVGKIGSSGNSTGPHLHFEVQKLGYPNDDPYAGSCSSPVSLWASTGSDGVPTTACGS